MVSILRDEEGEEKSKFERRRGALGRLFRSHREVSGKKKGVFALSSGRSETSWIGYITSALTPKNGGLLI